MKTAIAALCVLLAGCQTMPQTVEVKVAVPVKCQAQVPVEPVMPTDTLPSQASDFEIARAALAEIDIRDAYEDLLVAALKSCL